MSNGVLGDGRSVLELIELAYRDSNPEQWVESLLPSVRALLPHAVVAGAFAFSLRDAGAGLRLRMDSPMQWLGDPLYEERSLAALEQLPPSLADQAFPRTLAQISSGHTLDGQRMTAHPSWRTMWRPPIEDSLGLLFRDVSGHGRMFFTGLTTAVTLTPRERNVLTKLAIHLGAAGRLIDSSHRHLESADAILEPNGKVLHAKEDARTRREAIDDGRRRRREALKTRHDVDRALEIWRGLIAGRWSLVDHFDTDGKRFLLAMKNAPRPPASAALTPRERRVCALVAMGHRDKEVAYMLGLTLPVITAAVHRARRKLQAASRVELAAAWRRGAHAADPPVE